MKIWFKLITYDEKGNECGLILQPSGQDTVIFGDKDSLKGAAVAIRLLLEDIETEKSLP